MTTPQSISLFVINYAKWDKLNTISDEGATSIVEGNSNAVIEVLGERHSSLAVILLGDYYQVEFGAILFDHLLDFGQMFFTLRTLRIVEEYAGVIGSVGLQIHQPRTNPAVGNLLSQNYILSLCRCGP